MMLANITPPSSGTSRTYLPTCKRPPWRDPRTEKDSLEFYNQDYRGYKNIFTDCINMFNNDISRALLMPGLLGRRPTAGGSYAAVKYTSTFLSCW